MKCPRCQQDNPSHAKFCLGCGAPFGVDAALGGSYADLQAEIEQLRRSLGEAAEQQTATAEILRAISASSTGLQGVLDTVAARASWLCGAANVSLYQAEEDVMRKVAERGPQLTALPVGGTRPITRGSVSGRAILDRSTIHLRDQQAPEVRLEFPDGARQDTGIRTTVGIPLLREGLAIGAFTVYRTEHQPFSDAEIALLQTFANQAVIAIENARMFNQTQAALEQQTATSEILGVIASSPTDVQPVLDAVAESAARLCDAYDAWVGSLHGDVLRVVAHYGSIAVPVGEMVPAIRGTVTGRSVIDRRTVHVADLWEAVDEYPEGSELAQRLGFRTALSVPLLREGVPIGVIHIRRNEVRPFTDKQIALLATFADQAVIAIENVRLFTELQERNRALTQAHSQITETLEQQTATSEILRVISQSPTDVQPVFDAIVQSAVTLCEGLFGTVLRFDGERLHLAAHHNLSPEALQAYREHYPVRVSLRETVASGAILDRRVVQVIDSTNPGVPPRSVAMARATGFRGVVVVPMLRDGEPIGVINVARRERGPFTDREVSLLQTFADQAVIAIENVRLFNELQEKNQALTETHAQVTEALEQQTATAEILRVISRSPTDIQPVFDAIVRSAARLCDARWGVVFRYDGALVHIAAHHNFSEEQQAAVALQYPMTPTPAHISGRAILTGATAQIPDVVLDAQYGSALAMHYGYRSLLAVPILRAGAPIGVIVIYRKEPGPFAEQHIDLLQTFADQAVIAIENVRLFTELQEKNRAITEALDQQTATSDILRVISQSQVDVQPVFDTIIRNSVRLCCASHGGVYRFDGELVHSVAHEGYSSEQLQQWRSTWPKPVTASSVACAAIRTRSPFRVGDFETDPMRLMLSLETRENLRARGSRSVMAVPMLRHGDVIGAISLAHRDADAFSDTHVELLKTFSDQAVIAIENVRLFKELENANRELTAASQHKSEFLANMSHELRTPLNAIIGFSEVLGERMFGELNEKQEEYLKDIHASGQHLLSLINDILDLSKIEAGRMELELTDFDLPTAIDNALTLVRERAGRRGITLHQATDEGLGQIRGDERKLKQVLLNLLSNAIKFTPDRGQIDVRARAVDGSVEVSVSDTGVGIAPEDHEAIFEEFRQVGTADKKVEGTGLGLALSRKFIELHGGRIWVQSEPGVGSTFTFTLPRGPA